MDFVIDASFLINALALDGKINLNVRKFLWGQFPSPDTEIYAPSLLKYEIISNIFHKKRKEPEVSPEKVFLNISNFYIHFYDFSFEELIEIQNLAEKLSGKTKKEILTTYDASYLYLAKKLQAELLTEDKFLAGMYRRMSLKGRNRKKFA